MKILFTSYAFLPMLGGIEVISRVLAEEFTKKGHEVHLITETPGDGQDGRFEFAITRNPSLAEIVRLARWSDVVFQNNISIRSLLAARLARRRIVVVYQTWIRPTDGRFSVLHWTKAQASRLAARNIAISTAIANTIPARCELIPNPYNHRIFKRLSIERDRELVFCGRIVSDKGGDTLLDALGILAGRGLRPRLTIVGRGPEEDALKKQAATLGIGEQVIFRGPLRDEALAEEFNRHRVIVVPSRWDEPFGIVALEGIACGCIAIGSERGGLADAMGPCGLAFPNGDAKALASAIERVLADNELAARLSAAAPDHLKRHHGDAIASRYLEVFEDLVRNG